MPPTAQLPHRPTSPTENRTSHPPRPRGFTLVELLVVIGIIAVLIGILIPTLNKARQSAQATICVSQMRDIGMAMMQYLVDQKGVGSISSFTHSQSTGPHAEQRSRSVNWLYTQYFVSPLEYEPVGFLHPRYVKNPNVGACPSTTRETLPSSALTPSHIPYFSVGTVNITLPRVSKLRMPAETPMVADTANYTTSGLTTGIIFSAPISNPTAASPTFTLGVHGRHNGYAGVAWYDGHASLEKPYIPKTDTYFVTQNKPLVPKYQQAKLGFLTPVDPRKTDDQVKNDPMLNYYFWIDKRLGK